MRGLTSIMCLAFQLASGLVTPAWAEGAATNLSGKKLSRQVIVKAFLEEQELTFRSICKEGIGPGECPKIMVPKPVSLDQITFEFNSAELTPDARKVLALVGAALADGQVRERSFTVEGHTDAKGSEAYNLALSKRRAESVKRYLTTVGGIDTERLDVVPVGESDLLYPNDPDNPKNRRVVFRGVAEE